MAAAAVAAAIEVELRAQRRQRLLQACRTAVGGELLRAAGDTIAAVHSHLPVPRGSSPQSKPF